MQLVLATNNADKIAEIRHVLDDLPITILTKDDFLDFPNVDETADTLEGNAILKARALREATGLASLADDTGLEVDALGGAPGVYSARYAGPSATYADNCQKLLHELRDVPSEQRAARFRTVIAIDWGDKVEAVEGVVEGMITNTPHGSSGFGYDPVFLCPGLKQTFAEMSLEDKNAISHRGQALLKAREIIFERINRRVAR